ncbi:MAG: co-chaperone YbbN [Verrucomicrobiaceae bacterium]|nr:co-chaperone YbbN [Verrucomicrobiaceae bacterium]
MSEYIVNVTMANAKQLLIDESFQRPVIVDFWADWCAPCKTLMPLLEKIADEYAGQFLLAKVNCDEEQQIAQQFGVRSLPTVMVMKDGQPADGFVGAQTEKAVREMLEKYLPKPWDIELQQAREAIAAGDYGTALSLLRHAYDASRKRADIALELAGVLVALKRFDEAQAQLDLIKMADREQRYHQLIAQLELQREAAKTPEIRALEESLKSAPDDLETAYSLALQYSQNEQHREALDLLIEILRKNKQFRDGGARKALLDIIAVLGNNDPLAKEYQRKLFSLMY